MGVFANLPIGMAPGLGLNAYVGPVRSLPPTDLTDCVQFAYSIVGFHGTGMISYQEGLAAVFLEGSVQPFQTFL